MYRPKRDPERPTVTNQSKPLIGHASTPPSYEYKDIAIKKETELTRVVIAVGLILPRATW
jgi:hypothetical protein